MEFTKFTRKPFEIEAVEITEENLEAVAALVGTIEMDDEGRRYIQANKKKVPLVKEVYPGFWLTKMGSQIRCYKPDIFVDQFVPVQ